MKSAEQVRILVVDDTEQARYATVRVLRSAGFTVLEAATGRDGMQKALEHPDLIIMDVKLPDANGIELSRQLKASAETHNIPVLQLSATCIAISDKVRGLEAGADAYLTGPVASDELLATIRVLLRLSYAQETLSRAEQRQRLALQLGRAFSFEWDPISDEVMRSEESGKILGLTGEEIARDTGSNYFKRIHSEDREQFRNLLGSLTPESNTYRAGYRVVRKDGTVVQIEEAGQAFFDSMRTMTALIGISQDVTERKRVEEALIQSESVLRSFFESAPMMCGIIEICGEDIIHVFDNPATLAYFKLEKSDMVGMTARELGVPEHIAKLWHGHYAESAKAGRPVYFEYSHEGRWLGTTVASIPSRDFGRPRCCYISEDITDRKNFESELERKVRERTLSLQETTEQLNDFCYSIAHDLKAPIRGQTSFASMLLTDYGDVLDETGREYIRRIYESAVRQATLVNDLLTHMSLGRSELPLEPVDVAKAIKAVLQEYHDEIKEKGAHVDAEEISGRVMANQSSLHLVLSNLVSNALKFVAADKTPEVRIVCRVEGPECFISVQDNGIGVEPEYASRIWGVFQRLHTKERYPGTGIGLAIVKKAVERMGGTTGVESEPGKGSTFWVRLPRAV